MSTWGRFCQTWGQEGLEDKKIAWQLWKLIRNSPPRCGRIEKWQFCGVPPPVFDFEEETWINPSGWGLCGHWIVAFIAKLHENVHDCMFLSTECGPVTDLMATKNDWCGKGKSLKRYYILILQASVLHYWPVLSTSIAMSTFARAPSCILRAVWCQPIQKWFNFARKDSKLSETSCH